MIIDIHSRELAEDEHLAAATKVCLRHQHVQHADIYVTPRVPADAPAWRNPGWIEYLVRMDYETGGGMTVGVIQRKPGEKIECHS